jgi:hypothetical protein
MQGSLFPNRWPQHSRVARVSKVRCHNLCFECSRMSQWAISAWWIFRLTSALTIGPLVAHSVGKIELCVASMTKALLGICHVTCAS